MVRRAYVLQVEQDGAVQYLAAATTPVDAIRAVRQHVGEACEVRFTPNVLNAEQVALLDIRAGGVPRIRHPKGFGLEPLIAATRMGRKHGRK